MATIGDMITGIIAAVSPHIAAQHHQAILAVPGPSEHPQNAGALGGLPHTVVAHSPGVHHGGGGHANHQPAMAPQYSAIANHAHGFFRDMNSPTGVSYSNGLGAVATGIDPSTLHSNNIMLGLDGHRNHLGSIADHQHSYVEGFHGIPLPGAGMPYAYTHDINGHLVDNPSMGSPDGGLDNIQGIVTSPYHAFASIPAVQSAAQGFHNQFDGVNGINWGL